MFSRSSPIAAAPRRARARSVSTAPHACRAVWITPTRLRRPIGRSPKRPRERFKVLRKSDDTLMSKMGGFTEEQHSEHAACGIFRRSFHVVLAASDIGA